MDYVRVGTAKGPGELAHQYTLITPDRDENVKIGEFVFYTTSVGRASQLPVLGRVVKRTPVRLFPDSFLASPDVPPLEVAAAMGYTDDEDELFEIAVAVMGYFDPRLGGFYNPRVLPRSGTPVYLAPDEMLSEVLSRRQLGERGSAHVGSLLSRRADAVPIVLDVNEFTSTHMSIIAGTGAGKSYLAGVVIEELLRGYNRGCVLIADPHGEYETLVDMTDHRDFVAPEYRPRVKVLKPEHVKVRFSSLTLDDVRYLLPTMGERMEWILTEAFKRLHRPSTRRLSSSDYTRGDMINEFLEFKREANEGGPDYSSSVDGLVWRFERQFLNSPNFDDYEHLDLNQLFRPGQCTVLQLNEIDQRDQQVIVATILRRLLKARMDTEKGRVDESQENYLPYPAFVVLEEAHHFAPASADVVSSNVLKQVLSEGRKFGVGVGLISQRPGKLDADVLSQCMTHFIMRIVNPIDQNSIASAVESVGRDLLEELPALSKGQAVIAGSSLNSPVLCQTRNRLTRHGGASVAAAEEWAKYFEDRGRVERDRESVSRLPVTRSDVFRRE